MYNPHPLILLCSRLNPSINSVAPHPLFSHANFTFQAFFLKFLALSNTMSPFGSLKFISPDCCANSNLKMRSGNPFAEAATCRDESPSHLPQSGL